MAITYRIEPQNQLVLVRLSGTLSYDELVEMTDRLRADPEFRPHYRELAIAESFDATPETIQSLALRPPVFDERARRAVVVDSDLAFGTIRMFQTRRGEVAGEIRVFRDVDEARAWLTDGPELEEDGA